MSLTPAELGLANELYNQLMRQIAPPFPVVTPDNPSQEASGVAVLPYVSQETGD